VRPRGVIGTQFTLGTDARAAGPLGTLERCGGLTILQDPRSLVVERRDQVRTGNPAVLGVPGTGGFASSPFDEFAFDSRATMHKP